MSAQPLVLVETSDLPDYPFGRDDTLHGQWFVKFETGRWFQSDFYLQASLEAQALYLNLIFKSYQSRPVGTIPADPVAQARLLGIELELWRRICRQDPSPLHNWRPFRCDGGEVRLGHAVVIDSIHDQFTRREAASVKRSTDADRQRRARLRKELAALGVDARMLGNAALIEQMDAWLMEHVRGNRGAEAYARVLKVAAAEGWFGAV